MTKRGWKILAIFLAIVIVAVFLVSGFGSSWFTNGNFKTWFNSWGAGGSLDNSDDTGEEDYSGLIVSLESDSEIMTLSVDDNGESADSVTVTATINDPASRYRNFVFSFDWLNDYNNPVSDYITPMIQGNSVTVTCLQAFKVPIILTATLEGTDASASYRFDYLRPLDTQKLGDIWYVSKGLSPTSSVNSLVLDYDRETPNNTVYTAGSGIPNIFGEGTIKGAFEVNSIEISIPQEIREAMEESNEVDKMSLALGSTVSVPEKIEISDFTETDKSGFYSFNFNVFDFFNFSDWDFETDLGEIEDWGRNLILDKFYNNPSLFAFVKWSYVCGDKSWTHVSGVTFNLSFDNIMTNSTDFDLVDSNGNNGYVFGG